MERNLLKYVWMHSRSDQLWMVFIILASMPTYFLSLELPKRIVNGPIQGVGFENPGDSSTILQFNLPFGETLFGAPVELFPGFELERVGFLMALSTAFLALVVANGLFKLYINTYKGRMGERILRRLRYELFDRVLRYPLARFRRTKASEVASMIKDEVEPMGEFIGDAFTQPLFLGGQALVALLFIFLQNVWLGLATMVVIGFQAWLIPVLRRRLIVLGKQRQIAARQLAGRLGEVVEGIQDAHTNDTTNYERAEVTSILGKLFFIRFELYQRKFSVKFINNLLIQFLSFFFYAVGGYLAIIGTLDIGQLIGVIVAYKDLPAPVRGLIDHDQKRLIVETRYEQIIEQFTNDGLRPPSLHRLPEGPVPNIEEGYEISRLAVIDDTGSKQIETASAKIGQNERIAVVGNFNGGANTFVEVLGGVVPPSSGRVMLDNKPIEEQPEYLLGRRISYIDGTTYFPQGSILDILTYVLKNQPIKERERDEAERKHAKLAALETERSANFPLDFEAEWLDLDRMGVEDEASLFEQIQELLTAVDIQNDIRSLGLRGILDEEKFPGLSEQILEARSRFRERLDDLGLDEIVEPFDPDKYNDQSSVAENLLFGTPADERFELDNLPQNDLVISVLRDEGLEEVLFNMGREIAATTIELFGDLNPDDPFFNQLTYMNADELPEYRGALGRMGDSAISEVDPKDKLLIMRLPFAYIEDQNRLGLLTDDLKAKIMDGRKKLHAELEKLPDNPVTFYNPESYNATASIQDNVLLGRISGSVAEGYERVTEAVRDLLEEMELTDDIFRIGLEFNIGSGGKRLSEVQRQKLHLARALLKRPDVLIANQALNTLGGREQQKMIEMVLERSRSENGFGVIWVPMNASLATEFDRIIIFKDGDLVSDGPAEDISEKDTIYAELVA